MDDQEIRLTAALMLQELVEMKQTVIVIPDGRPNSCRGIRCVVMPNPEWYSRLCGQFTRPRPRKSRTIIKRRDTLRTLEQIATHGINAKIEYHNRLLDAIEYVANR